MILRRIKSSGRRMASASQSTAHVLIVDDNLDHVQTMAYLLKMDGHHVDYAINGTVGLDLADRTKPEIMLVDIGLPDMSGLQLVRRLRAIEHLKQACIIAVTGGDIERAEALKAGFNDLIRKPVDLRALNEMIARR
jgi:DNA-binding response OmpR family regulator